MTQGSMKYFVKETAIFYVEYQDSNLSTNLSIESLDAEFQYSNLSTNSSIESLCNMDAERRNMVEKSVP